MVWGLSAVAYLGEASLAKALLMAAFGVFISTIGVDIVTGTDRFTYDVAELLDGIDFLILIIGFFCRFRSSLDPGERRRRGFI